ncbi:MAG: hypothetical protein NW241_13590 [Bacteroidia bacterium]|nr:hypothetical protein [Bacteroidia bacterium]
MMQPNLNTFARSSALFLAGLFAFPALSCGQTGSAGDPFTALSQAWGAGTSGTYYFLIGGTPFSTYVDAGSGWILAASGAGSTEESSYSTTTSLALQADEILPAAIYTSTLVTAVRISASSGPELPFDIMTDDAGVLANLQSNVTLSVGTSSATWTGTGTSRVEGGCGSSSSTLDTRIYHCGCNGSGLHWLVADGTGLEKISYGESSQNDLNLWIRTDAPVFPVTLSYFEAAAEAAGRVGLRWQTLAEHNSSFFAVERSSDLRIWERIGQVDAAGTSSVPRTYLFSDLDPVPGVSYYRLRQTDQTGAYGYSEVREIAGPHAVLVRAFPNPAAAMLAVEGDPAELSALRICSLTGQDLSRLVTMFPVQGRRRTLDLTHLPAGVYLLTAPHHAQRVYKE